MYSLKILRQHNDGTRYLMLNERIYFIEEDFIYDNRSNLRNPSPETLFNAVGFPLTKKGLEAIGL